MRDVLADLVRWRSAGRACATATVVRTWQSAPRPVGSTMAVASTGEVAGSISGGCVEADVHERAREVIRTGEPALLRYGVSDPDAFAVGLVCGGTIEVFVQRADPVAFPELDRVAAAVSAAEPVALATVVTGDRVGRRMLVHPPGHEPTVPGAPALDARVQDLALAALRTGRSASVDLDAGAGASTVLVEVFEPSPRMLVFGSIDTAASLATLGAFLGYRVTVCDVRPVFTVPHRFPAAEEVVVAWPHRYLASTPTDERTVVCVLTHDPRIDVPLLAVALRTPAAYVGAMGSRRTHADRLDRLHAAGMTEAELARLSSPLGLDLGAQSAAETALSIAAEITALRGSGSGRRLRGLQGPIHRHRGDGALDAALAAGP